MSIISDDMSEGSTDIKYGESAPEQPLLRQYQRGQEKEL